MDEPTLRRLARDKLDELIAAVPPGRAAPLCESVTRDGVTWTVAIAPETPALPPHVRLSPCMRGILLTLLELHPDRATTDDLQAEMTNRGREWGRSTIKFAASQLIHAGLLTNDHNQLGYGLTALGTGVARSFSSGRR